ncbi:MAG: AAA family ATPase [Bacteroidaceae bacterium]|nr:AAA family ATPase [Bacteroidaceae bacterium]
MDSNEQGGVNVFRALENSTNFFKESPFLIDLSQDIELPEPILTKDGTNLFSVGEISCVSGAAKSRKTFFLSAITVAYLSEEGYLGFKPGNIKSPLLLVDTEQGMPFTYNVVRRIHNMMGWDAGQNNKNLKVINFRKLTPETRLQALEQALKIYKPAFCLIDGVADLVTDVNDAAEASDIVSWLMKNSSEYNCHILCVLHTNPFTDKQRGHLGSMLIRKCETVINLTREGDFTVAKEAYGRNKEVPSTTFTIDQSGFPILADMPCKTNKKESLKADFKAVMPASSSIAYTDLVRILGERLNFGIGKAKCQIKRAVENNVIEKNEAGFYSINY